MTQRTKLDLMEKKLERIRPYRTPNRGIFHAGKTALVYLWRVLKTIELMEIDGPFTDVKWVEEARPNQAELLETAEVVNWINNVDIRWEELE